MQFEMLELSYIVLPLHLLLTPARLPHKHNYDLMGSLAIRHY